MPTPTQPPHNPRRTRLTTRTTTLAASLTGALLAGWLWSALEIRALLTASIPLLDATAAATTANLLFTAIACIPAALLATLATHPRLGRALYTRITTHSPPLAARITSACLALFALSYMVFFASQLFSQLFAAERIRTIALAGTIPALTLTAGAVYFLSNKLLIRLTRTLQWRPAHTTTLLIALTTATFLWAISFFALVPQVFEEFQPIRFAPALLSLAGALAGALFAAPKIPKTILITTPILLLLTTALATYSFTQPTSPEQTTAIAQKTHATHQVSRLLASRAAPKTSLPQTNTTGAATCYPGVEPLTTAQIQPIPKDAPDIIFVTVDAFRWDHTTMAGYKRDTTPQLARISPKGALFEAAYTPAASTRQSFRGIFTGIYPSLVAAPPSTQWGTSFAPEQETIATYLHAAGYRTVAIVSDPGAFPQKHGALKGFEIIDTHAEAFQKSHKYSAPYKIDRIIAELSDPTDPRPLFIWTHLREAHQRYGTGPKPKNFGKQLIDRYDSALHFLDTELARLIHHATTPHNAPKTYLFIGSDHGEAFNEHGHKFHGATVHQEQTRVPLLAFGPDIKPARHTTPVSMLDILPTTLDLLAIAPSTDAFCGQSLANTLRTAQPPPSRPIYIEQIPDKTRKFFSIAYISPHHTLILDPTTLTTELYNMTSDPLQKHNLTQTQPDKTRLYLQQLRTFHKTHGMNPTTYNLDRF